jgi:hypothetical protein
MFQKMRTASFNILLVIDVFSRKGAAEVVPDKTGPSLVTTLKVCFRRLGGKPATNTLPGTSNAGYALCAT